MIMDYIEIKNAYEAFLDQIFIHETGLQLPEDWVKLMKARLSVVRAILANPLILKNAHEEAGNTISDAILKSRNGRYIILKKAKDGILLMERGTLKPYRIEGILDESIHHIGNRFVFEVNMTLFEVDGHLVGGLCSPYDPMDKATYKDIERFYEAYHFQAIQSGVCIDLNGGKHLEQLPKRNNESASQAANILLDFLGPVAWMHKDEQFVKDIQIAVLIWNKIVCQDEVKKAEISKQLAEFKNVKGLFEFLERRKQVYFKACTFEFVDVKLDETEDQVRVQLIAK